MVPEKKQTKIALFPEIPVKNGFVYGIEKTLICFCSERFSR